MDMGVTVNLNKAKNIAHEKRRQARAAEFAPHDEVIMKQIPGTDLQEIEAARQAIREKYATLQEQMDAAQTPEELKALLPEGSHG
jgi:predicted  nucleic acid-binding Zn-ribbon protein